MVYQVKMPYETNKYNWVKNHNLILSYLYKNMK